LFCCFVVLLFCCFVNVIAQEKWEPKKTITLIVPWGAGGASDQTARILAAEMEPLLGVKIAVVNQPGASGSIGAKSVYDAEHDGYTWLGSSNSPTATFELQGLTPDIPHTVWRAFFAVYTPCVICVNPDSSIKDWDGLVEAFKTREVKVASAGIGAGGHSAAETFAQEMGVEYKHVPYSGGNPAVTSTVAGETEVVMQLSMEVADLLRAKKLRPIAVMANDSLNISDYGEIPSITVYKEGFSPVGFYFGIIMPKDIPAEALDTITDAFKVASTSESIKKMAEEKGSMAVSIYGDAGIKEMEIAASQFGWLLYDSGVVEISPEEFGIPKL
jgi:tripartite-type tricarboxylate transporter receptor subunit TctC